MATNERLRRALGDAGLTVGDLAARLAIDPKTVQRWITTARVPHPANRATVARLLGLAEAELWPQVERVDREQVLGEAELLRLYPHRWDVPNRLWRELFEATGERIDVLAYSGQSLGYLGNSFPELLRAKAAEGVAVRLLYGDPESEAVARRGREERIADGLLARRIGVAIEDVRPAFNAPGIQVRLHRSTLYTSIFRYDDEMLVTAHVYGSDAAKCPVLQIRRQADGGLFDHYMASLELVWEQARPL